MYIKIQKYILIHAYKNETVRMYKKERSIMTPYKV